MLSGVLVVDKPSGPTSHDIVDRVRRVLRERRVGHTGTLDPFATGVLPICLGKATRLARFLAQGDKLYRATVRLGFATTTDDLQGEPLGAVRPFHVDLAQVREAVKEFVGEIQQVPPAFSAKRVDGTRSYHLARQGVIVPREAVSVVVHALDVLAFEKDRVEIEVRCSPGTYVRAIARDLGADLGCGGHLVSLRRLKSGAFSLDGAVEGFSLGPEARRSILPMGELLCDLPALAVTHKGLEALRHGRDLDASHAAVALPDPLPPRTRLVDEAGELLALAVPAGTGALHPDVVLVE
jgi:tRNA pseudouridine55 synthase